MTPFTQLASTKTRVQELKTYVFQASIQRKSTNLYQIINHIHATLAKNPSECFILEGYSQGAAATVNAMPKLTGAAFTAVKGVFLIGDPEHKAGLACNVDSKGGDTTKNVNGLESNLAGIPSNWVSKTLDVCAYVSFPVSSLV